MAGKVGRGIYSTRRWAVLRHEVLELAGWRCARCNRFASEVHHLQPLHRRPDLAFNRSNVEPLCRTCHQATHHPPDPDAAAWRELLRRPPAAGSVTRVTISA